ncbi:DUF2612 domain-containing protein [Photorhabdus laumondii subsp. laumondii]|uniref:DUF2612 domain-containing protein n=1 Tax=Photorhabdus laumondii subsp. laumondii TaxID=141679 RepID=A0A6L9JSZ1_PHOLM|nr:DUF2612 domain-containing protein [Photorhabdus laumondii]MCC8384980.1 DUF2612 domain-containing protein [Photorhabdus laumondii]MCC8413686.1 DUF2612 domain-containing protein [Photorhabdus laumondii]NDK96848.1 DUF2612 domain-containing protein [Photorhabdus laumondii subsp. laumondii]NDL23044.1 DUF2612 domain-containing protein [Photorhabdus laumondii subsp. laumondii]NDL32043.1 DUF2612 domain-containing protein [Photorhabdus laumondii subsp. laumondii]
MRDYLSLITPQHRTANKFVTHIDFITRPISDIINAAHLLNSQFSIDEAIGVQLDAVGEWIGLSRYVKTPIVGVYFAFDIEGVGLDEGSWKRQYDSDSGFTELDDETYRTVLRSKIRANHWDGTNEMLAEIYQGVIPDESVLIFFVDNKDMSMDVYVTGGVVPEVVKAVIQQGYLNIKPGAVRVNNYTNSENQGVIFGFDSDSKYIAGFDVGGWPILLN